MTRFTATENQTATSLTNVPYIAFADFDFPSGHVRLNSSVTPYSFGGNTYGAAGTLASIGSVTESSDLSPDKLEFQLSGVDNSLLLTVLGEKYHGRSASLYIGYLDYNSLLVSDPQLLWEGRMDVMSILTDTGSSIISLVCENRLVLWSRSSGWLYSQDHQNLLFTSVTDVFFNQVETLTDKLVKWGDKTVTTFYRPPQNIPPFIPGNPLFPRR